MLENNKIKSLIEKGLNANDVRVDGDGYHYQLVVVSDDFKDLGLVARQKKIYQVLGEHVKSGELHALSLKTYTVDEWQEKNNG